MSCTYAGLVAQHGLSESHRLVIAAVPEGARVLDIGCATGYVAEQLGRRGCQVIGLEPDPDAAQAARAHCVEVVVGDVEQPATRAELPTGRDVVLFADVLEHLREPLDTLRFAATLLDPGGRVIVSVPNIGHWTARRALLRGRFPYADHGLFDRTHLRFFTRSSAHALARDAGYEVTDERFTAAPLPLESRLRTGPADSSGPDGPPPAAVRALAAALLRRWPELFALQVVLTLRPRRSARAPDAAGGR